MPAWVNHGATFAHRSPLDIEDAIAAVLLGLCALAAILVLRRRWVLPLTATLAVGAGLRIAVAALAYHHTPHDVLVSFHAAGEDVLHGRDPMTSLPRYQWNFLPFSAYIFAAEIKTGLPWAAAAKVVPVLCDLGTIVLIGRLAPAKDAATARLVYAVCPLALLVSAWHGQIEPIAIFLGLAALLAARSQRAVLAGLLAGLAAAAKTWPALYLVGVLAALPWRRWWRSVLVAVAVLAGFLFLVPVSLNDSLSRAVHVLTGYRSWVGAWGWTGIMHGLRKVGTGFASRSINPVARIGTMVLAVTEVIVIILFRRARPEDLTVAILLAFLVVTDGFGPQYLLWPAALLCVRGRRAGEVYLVLAGAYTGFFYLYAVQRGQTAFPYWPGAVLEGVSLAIIATAILAMPWNSVAVPRVPALAWPAEWRRPRYVPAHARRR